MFEPTVGLTSFNNGNEISPIAMHRMLEPQLSQSMNKQVFKNYLF
jgi:hypothetical protein